MRSLRLGLAQINPAVGDLQGNRDRIIDFTKRAEALGVDLLCFPELVITGYPPEGLLLKPDFVSDNLKSLEEVISFSHGRDIAPMIGFVDAASELYNAAAVIYKGELKGICHKIYLGTDEGRYFKAGKEFPLFLIGDVKCGLTIGEDIWQYPASSQSGVQLIVNISSSPYQAGKREKVEEMLSRRASESAAIVAQVNLIGGQDELVFGGNSLAFSEKGKLLARGKEFEEDIIISQLSPFPKVPSSSSLV